MTLKMTYYAILREQTGKNSEDVNFDVQNPVELYSALQDRYDLSLNQDQLQVAVNNEFVSFEHPLKDGDRVVFIPPVAGG